MKRATLLSLVIFLAMTTNVAQAHNVGHKGKDTLAQYLYFKKNLDHANQFLVENDNWQVMVKNHWMSLTTSDIQYHKNLARNSYQGILSLVPHRKQWKCIHGFEGAWNDPNSPYYGGLQMDLGFQDTYGRYFLRLKGTADHWTPLEQMLVAEIAFKTRGFYPWPNTARYCHLI